MVLSAHTRVSLRVQRPDLQFDRANPKLEVALSRAALELAAFCPEYSQHLRALVTIFQEISRNGYRASHYKGASRAYAELCCRALDIGYTCNKCHSTF